VARKIEVWMTRAGLNNPSPAVSARPRRTVWFIFHAIKKDHIVESALCAALTLA